MIESQMPLNSNGEPDYEAIEKIIMQDKNAKINYYSPMDKIEDKNIDNSIGMARRHRELLDPYDFSAIPDEPETEQADNNNIAVESTESPIAVKEQQPVSETSEPEITAKQEPVKQNACSVNSSRFNIALTGLCPS